MSITTLPRLPNQGQMIAAGWNNTAGLRNITALLGTDSLSFAPVSDRNYNPGVTRRLATGGTLDSGMPIIIVTSPWISDGQIEYLYTTLLSGSESGNVTYRGHTPLSVGVTDVSTFNAVLNLNLHQLADLQRLKNGYRDFEWEVVITEVL